MAKKFTVKIDAHEGLDEALNNIERRQYVPEGVKLSQVKYIPPSQLKDNPLNKKYFAQQSEDYLEKLTEDVRERGILVPLIAKQDGLLFAGHVRRSVALKINLERVPVQYVQNELTPDQERSFLLKDNLLRRQLSPGQKERLIRELYGEELFIDRRGGDRRSSAAKIKSSRELLKKTLPERIEEETGGHITAGTAKRITAKIRGEHKNKNKEQKKEKIQTMTFKYASVEDLIKQLEVTIAKLKKLS